MCLAYPGKVMNIWNDNGLRMGSVDFSGVVQTVCLAYTPEAGIGDYVIVHVGCAISMVRPDEAIVRQTLIQEALSEVHP